MTETFYQSYEDFGVPPVSEAKPEEILGGIISVNGVVTLPDEPSYEVFIQPEGGDIYIGSGTIFPIRIPDGATLIIEVANAGIISISGNATVRYMILR